MRLMLKLWSADFFSVLEGHGGPPGMSHTVMIRHAVRAGRARRRFAILAMSVLQQNTRLRLQQIGAPDLWAGYGLGDASNIGQVDRICGGSCRRVHHGSISQLDH